MLDQAMTAFWANGYEGTSMATLVSETGLHKGSLYQAFGNKRALFMAALRRYLDGMLKEKNRVVSASATPMEALANVMHGMLDIADADSSSPKGCMALNSLVELAPHDPDVQEMLVAHRDRMMGTMVDVVSRAQEMGDISDQRPPELVAALLFTFMAGLGAQIKGPLTMAEAHELLDAQLAAMS